MAVFTGTQHLPRFRNPVLTIGTFDGVHLGHRAILGEVVRYAKDTGGESILITFEPHPRKILFPGQPLHLLTSPDQKAELVTATGIDHIVIAPFTREFSELSAAAYIREFLVEKFHPKNIVIGYDHRFGNDRRGDLSLLRAYAGTHHFAVAEIPAQMIDAATVSSTKIRRSLAHGDVQAAAVMLGRQYSFTGTVIRGAQLGRTIGYPTANILPQDKEQLIPANGVYAVRVTADGKTLNGMMNIGVRPTVSNEMSLHLEAHLFDFSGDLYDKMIGVAFIARLRDEQKFASLDALKTQLNLDEIAARKALG